MSVLVGECFHPHPNPLPEGEGDSGFRTKKPTELAHSFIRSSGK